MKKHDETCLYFDLLIEQQHLLEEMATDLIWLENITGNRSAALTLFRDFKKRYQHRINQEL